MKLMKSIGKFFGRKLGDFKYIKDTFLGILDLDFAGSLFVCALIGHWIEFRHQLDLR